MVAASLSRWVGASGPAFQPRPSRFGTTIRNLRHSTRVVRNRVDRSATCPSTTNLFDTFRSSKNRCALQCRLLFIFDGHVPTLELMGDDNPALSARIAAGCATDRRWGRPTEPVASIGAVTPLTNWSLMLLVTPTLRQSVPAFKSSRHQFVSDQVEARMYSGIASHVVTSRTLRGNVG